MEELKDELRVFFENPKYKNRKYDFKEIKRAFCGTGNYKVDVLIDALDELEVEGFLYKDNRNQYRTFPHELGYVHGKIKINKHGEGFIITDAAKYKVKVNDLNGALDNDTVVLKTTNKMDHGHVVCKVDKLIKRDSGLVIVEIQVKDGEMVLVPFNAVLDSNIVINNMAMKALVEGDRVLVKIGQEKIDGKYIGGMIKFIGHKDDPDAELKMIAIENGIAIEFSNDALAEADALPTSVSKAEKKGRLDLTDKQIFSIDGAKTKDRDDAISIEINSKGNYVVGVHISDVSHYIKPGMKLWEEALSRSTSVYMVDTVIPMLPHKISNGICSLNPDVERLTLSCIMEVSPKGEILNYDFVDCVIKSKKAMTYDDVNMIFEQGEVPEGYEEFVDDLSLMVELASKLEHKKVQRGYVNFGSNDIDIEVDENGNPTKFSERKIGTAEKLIENFMLIAGECAANYLVIPTSYRVHESPDEDRVEEAFELLQKSGIRVKSTHEIVNGKVIQKLLEQIHDMDERTIAANIILRSMKRARYSVENVGHFGLGLNAYDQFTSPIRRSPDLVTHRNIRLQRDYQFDYEIVDSYYDQIDKFCQHATKKERSADQAEKDANQLEMIKFMSEHIGEKFEAHVTYVNSKGIYIKTTDGIEGKLRIEDIEGDDFYYDDRTASFNGKKSKIRIKIGCKLVLVAIDTKKEYRTVNFGMEPEDLLLLKKKRA